MVLSGICMDRYYFIVLILKVHYIFFNQPDITAKRWLPAFIMSAIQALHEWSVIGIWSIYRTVLYAYRLIFDETEASTAMDISKIAKNLIKCVASGEVGVLHFTVLSLGRVFATDKR